jgi:hypothetical protein
MTAHERGAEGVETGRFRGGLRGEIMADQRAHSGVNLGA